VACQKAFGHENLGRPQSSFRDIRCASQHDDGSLRLEPSHFNCKLLPFISGMGKHWAQTGQLPARWGTLHVVKNRQAQEQQGSLFEG